MTGIFLVEGMTPRSAKIGANRKFREYLLQQGVQVDSTTKICACKGPEGSNRTTAITLKDVIGDQKKTTFYLGLTDNSDTMEKGQWSVFRLDVEKMEEGFKDRYSEELGADGDLSTLLNNSKKNYRINIGWGNAESMGQKSRS